VVAGPAGAVVVVGSANADLVVYVDRLPRAGETVAGGTFERHWGGKGANQAVAARRHGASVRFVGAVGNDDLGDAALADLARQGVDVAHVARSVSPTGVALIVVDRGGENQIAVASGANADVSGAGLEGVLDEAGDGVVLTCFEIPELAVASAIRAAARAGWRVVVNPAPSRELPEALRGSGAILTPNEHELRAMTGTGDVEQAAHSLAALTNGPVVVSLGPAGALLVAAGSAIHVEAPPVEAQDSTGAGDVLNGVLAAALAEGVELREAVHVAVAAASFSVENRGARAQLSRAELLARIRR
jgi:ribokinase